MKLRVNLNEHIYANKYIYVYYIYICIYIYSTEYSNLFHETCTDVDGDDFYCQSLSTLCVGHLLGLIRLIGIEEKKKKKKKTVYSESSIILFVSMICFSACVIHTFHSTNVLYVQATSNIVFPLSFLCDLTKIDDDLCCCETWMVALNCEMYLWYIQNLQNTVVHRIINENRWAVLSHFGDIIGT